MKKSDINKIKKILKHIDFKSPITKIIIGGIVIIAILLIVIGVLGYINAKNVDKNLSFNTYMNEKIAVLEKKLEDVNGKTVEKTSENTEQKTVENTNEKTEAADDTKDEVKPNGKIKNLKVKRIVDGDTVELEKNGKTYKVRLIGVNTPESVHLDKAKNTKEGKIASEFTKNKLTGKTVDIEFDVSPTDKYGRYLAYLYVDGYSYNEMLLEEGMAEVMMYAPNVKYKELYKQIEKRAKDKKIGIWK